MPQIIDVKGFGQVQFPDGMSDDQIAQAIKNNLNDLKTPNKYEDSPFMANLTAFNSGVENFTHGTLQPLLESGKLGDKVAEGSKLTAQNRNQDLRQAKEAYPKTAGTAEFVGGLVGTSPTWAIPGIGKKKLAKLATQGLAQGVLSGAMDYVDEGESRGMNMFTGGALGALLPVGFEGLAQLPKAGAKLFNAFKGNLDNPEYEKLINFANKEKVPIYASDVAQTPKLNAAAQFLEEVPFIGMRGEREAQMKAAQSSAQKFGNQLQSVMQNMGFGDKNFNIKNVAAIANSNSPRSKAANQLLEQIGKSGDDWTKILQNSGNFNLFKNKVVADKLYGDVAKVADTMGNIDTSNTIKAVDNMLTGLNKDVLKNEPLIGILDKIKTNLFEPQPAQAASKILDASGQPVAQAVDSNLIPKQLSYSDFRNLRSSLGDEISKYFTGANAVIGKKGVGYLENLKTQIEKQMSEFVNSKGSNLSELAKTADNFYQNNVIPYKDKALAKALKSSEPDTIFAKFIQRTNNQDRAMNFYNALDNKGKAAVKYGIVDNALQKSIDPEKGMFSPAIFKNEIKAYQGANNIFFQNADKNQLDGFVNLMSHIDRSKTALTKPETGVKLIPYAIGAGAGYAAHAEPTTLIASIGGTLGLKKLMTTDAGRNFLLASSKLKPGSPAMQSLFDSISKAFGLGAKAARQSAVVGALQANEGESQ